MKKLPELKPNRYDALLAAAVLLLALALGARLWLANTDTALCVVVSIDGAEVERFPLGDAERVYRGGGYTIRVTASRDGVRVAEADCPTRDCVRTGTISRAGESIVCLPARIVISLEGAAEFDAVAG